jgi:hypothetical protein|tara:strand:+ start:194 stop:451 length:258 start_codon:yes stop_codon:yes gene_type:complete
MDQGTQKEEIRNLYLTAEMAVWGDNSIKEKNQMDWLKGRIKEISTWSGASLVALGLLVVLGGPFVKLAAYAAIIWGIISMVKKQG